MNRNHQHFFIRTLCLSVFLLGLSAAASAQEIRTFTNKAGQKIEAEILGVEDKMVEIRRSADKATFKIPVATLSFEDQVWISEWIKKQNAPGAPAAGGGVSQDGWGTLRVKMPHPMDTVDVLGLETTIGSVRLGGSTHELRLPDGAWVRVRGFTSDQTGATFNQLIRYNGAGQWTFSLEGPLLLLARDGGESRIHGITLPDDAEDHEDFLREIDPARLAESLSVKVPTSFEARTLKKLGAPIVSVSSLIPLQRENVVEIAKLKPKAIDLAVFPQALDAFDSFAALEALGIRQVRSSAMPARRRNDPIRLPIVRDLSLRSVPFDEDLGKEISKIKSLRLFDWGFATLTHFSGTAPEGSPINRDSIQVWEGIDALQNLEGLHLNSLLQVRAKELAQLPSLRSLKLGLGAIAEDDPDLADLAKLSGLLHLSIADDNFSADSLNAWAQSGGLGGVRHLNTYVPFDFGALTSLEILSLTGSSRTKARYDLTQLAPLANLKFLAVSNVGQRELDGLASFGGREKIEVLRLHDGTFHEVKALDGFTGIKRLAIFSHEGSLYDLDAAKYPKLEYLYLSQMKELENVKGLAAHPNLQHFRASACELLAGLGDSAPNQALRSIQLLTCPKLENLSALDETTGLVHLMISNCDGLKGPLKLEKTNNLGHVSIVGCDNLENRQSGRE